MPAGQACRKQKVDVRSTPRLTGGRVWAALKNAAQGKTCLLGWSLFMHSRLKAMAQGNQLEHESQETGTNPQKPVKAGQKMA